MPREVALDIPEETQPINAVGELSPSANLTLNAQDVPVHSSKQPGKFLVAQGKILSLSGISPLCLQFCMILSFRERSKLKGNFCPRRSLSKS